MSFVLAVDIGSTSLRCFAFDQQAKIIARSFGPVTVLHPEAGSSEIEPDEVWTSFTATVKATLLSENLDIRNAVSLGITCQRNSFLLWHRKTGRPLCNLITWQDRRCAPCCNALNNSVSVRVLRAVCSIGYAFTRNNHLLVGSIMKFAPMHVCSRLYWALHTVPDAFDLAENGLVCFGTLDSWILWKLTAGKVHATDCSNASATFLYDPILMCWSSLILTLLGIPKSILPEVKDTSGDFGVTAEEVFGAAIPIGAIVADQQSALFAQCCWNKGDMKATFGTGTFLNVNTGSYVHASACGVYPLVGWKIGTELCYVAECHAPSTGSAVEWAKSFGLFDDVAKTEEIVESVCDSNGVCFVPSFDGMQVPYEDPCATATVVGLSHSTKKEHVLRALLESFGFQFKELYDKLQAELNLSSSTPIKVDGGVANNNFVLKLACDLTGQTFHKPTNLDMTVFGAALLAGLAQKFWNRKNMAGFWALHETIISRDATVWETEMKAYNVWLLAAERSCDWCK